MAVLIVVPQRNDYSGYFVDVREKKRESETATTRKTKWNVIYIQIPPIYTVHSMSFTSVSAS